MSAKKKKSAAAGDIHLVSVADIFNAAVLADVPTLEQAASLDIHDEGPVDDWRRLCASVKAVGMLEPIKCVPAEGGKWECYDGRSRLAAARVNGDAVIAVAEITAAQAAEIVTASLARRHVPIYVLAYLECLKHEGRLVAAGRGRKTIAEGDEATQSKLAERVNCSRPTIIACVAALRHFQDHPADRERDEPRILAGLLSPERVACGAGGRAATEGKPRKPSDYVSWLPKLKSFTSTARSFHTWKPADVENAARALAEAVKEWPLALREVVAATCAANAEPSPSESAAKKKGPKV